MINGNSRQLQLRVWTICTVRNFTVNSIVLETLQVARLAVAATIASLN